MTFEERVHEAAEQSIINLFRSGDCLKLTWEHRAHLDPAHIRQIYAAVDMDRVKAAVLPKVEQLMADAIVASLATEIGTDVKKIMCNTELREDLRAFLRAKIREGAKAIAKQDS